MQNVKLRSRSEMISLDCIATDVIQSMEDDVVYFTGAGTIEECGDSSTNEIYGMILRTGVHYIIADAINHPDYWGTEGELAEVCCPIELDDFNEDQRK